jgi:hypothetical protein
MTPPPDIFGLLPMTPISLASRSTAKAIRKPAACRPISRPPAPENSPMAEDFVRLLKVRLEV